MRATASQITGVSIVYPTVGSGTDERKHQSSVSLAFVRGIDRWPVNSSHKRPVMRKMFPSIWWRHHEENSWPLWFDNTIDFRKGSALACNPTPCFISSPLQRIALYFSWHSRLIENYGLNGRNVRPVVSDATRASLPAVCLKGNIKHKTLNFTSLPFVR